MCNALRLLRYWPKHLQYMFNKTSLKVAKVIILTLYEIFAS